MASFPARSRKIHRAYSRIYTFIILLYLKKGNVFIGKNMLKIGEKTKKPKVLQKVPEDRKTGPPRPFSREALPGKGE